MKKERRMRTTLTIPDDLYREASSYVEKNTPSKTIVQVFNEFIRQKKKQKLMAMAGKAELSIDLKGLRKQRNER